MGLLTGGYSYVRLRKSGLGSFEEKGERQENREKIKDKKRKEKKRKEKKRKEKKRKEKKRKEKENELTANRPLACLCQKTRATLLVEYAALWLDVAATASETSPGDRGARFVPHIACFVLISRPQRSAAPVDLCVTCPIVPSVSWFFVHLISAFCFPSHLSRFFPTYVSCFGFFSLLIEAIYQFFSTIQRSAGNLHSFLIEKRELHLGMCCLTPVALVCRYFAFSGSLFFLPYFFYIFFFLIPLFSGQTLGTKPSLIVTWSRSMPAWR